MKKNLLILLIAVMAISCGCMNNTAKDIIIEYKDTYIENQDFQYNFFDKSTGQTIVQKGNGGYYFVLNDFFYFVDENTMNAVPLCNKTDCLHDKETDPEKVTNCNAYLSGFVINPLFCIYEDRIYKIADESYYEGEKLIIVNSIYQCNSDGTGSKKVFSINQNISRWFIHRGIIYYTTDVNNILMGYDLSNNKENAVVDLDSIGLYNAVVENITVYGNNIYIILNGYESEEDYKKMVGGEEITTIEEIYAVNIVDNSNYTVKSETGFSGLIFEGFFDDCLIVSDADYNAENPEKKMYSIDKNGNKKLLDYKYASLYDFCYFDNNFTYMKKGTDIDDVQKNFFEVYSKDKLLTTIDFPDGYVNGIYLGDEDYLFYYEDNENIQRLYYISKKDLSEGSARLNIIL